MTSTATRPAAPQAGGAGWRTDLLAALPGWIVARLVVGLAWVVQLVEVEVRRGGRQPHHAGLGLLAYDADVYRNIAEHGYGNIGFDALRFPPLVSLVGVNGTGIVVLANVCGLLAAALIHRLALEVTEDADLARRAATLVGLAPPAFTLVWGYSEGPFLVLAAGQLLALRRGRWGVAGLLGLLAALTRTSGLLLAVPAAWEAARALRRFGGTGLSPASIPARAWAVLGPVVGTVSYLVWVEVATGKGMAPVEIQSELRRGTVFPPLRLLQGIGELVTDPLNDGLHVPFAFGMVALVWVCWKRLPGSWTALAVVSVSTILAAELLNSIERYAYGTVPLLVAGASVCGGRWWRPTIILSSLCMFGMTLLAWYGPFVP